LGGFWKRLKELNFNNNKPMKKYKLINRKNNEETLCDKVTVEGFDYYVSDKLPKDQEVYWTYIVFDEPIVINKCNLPDGWFERLHGKINYKSVIATNNPSIDIPKVVDENNPKVMFERENPLPNDNPTERTHGLVGISGALSNWFEARKWFQKGYNKSQETHPYSEEDILNLLDLIFDVTGKDELWDKVKDKTTKELLTVWQSQRTETIYFE